MCTSFGSIQALSRASIVFVAPVGEIVDAVATTVIPGCDVLLIGQPGDGTSTVLLQRLAAAISVPYLDDRGASVPETVTECFTPGQSDLVAVQQKTLENRPDASCGNHSHS